MNNLAEKFLLDPEITFLNHGSFGATPEVVFKHYQALQLELERQPIEFLARELDQRMDDARESLATYLDASPSNLIFVANVTVAINIVARNLRLGPGDQVLASDHEYGAMDRLWRFLSKRRGFEYKIQEIPTPFLTEGEILEALWKGVTDRTRVIFLSHITSPTALRMPVNEICLRAREENIITVIDGAHAPGQIDLELEALGADFYGANLHKWLCAPKGSGFLHARPEHHEILEPLVVSWGWESEKPGPSIMVDYHEWQGTRDPAAFLATPTAIEFQQKYDWNAVRDQCHELAVGFQQKVNALTGFEPLSLPSFYEQMVAVRLPNVDPEAFQKRLYDEYRIEIPVFLWNEQPLLRICVQGYNSADDVERVVTALKKLI
jgi:isopenicillin-N epimerase